MQGYILTQLSVESAVTVVDFIFSFGAF